MPFSGEFKKARVVSLWGRDSVHPWLERGSLPVVCEAAGERARQGDGGVQAGALTLIFDVNCAFGKLHFKDEIIGRVRADKT